jgi:DNA-binding GntR family transcriptional regulator
MMAERGLFEQIQTVSAAEAVASRLRDLILDGVLVPGEQLTEGWAVDRFRVSRPTVKTAITVLVNDGLLRREANKPAYVPQLSSADVDDLFLVRTPLELEVVQIVSDRGLAPPGALQAVRDIAAYTDDQPTSRFVQADLGFHRSLIDSVASPRLSRLYRMIQGEIHMSMVQSKQVLGAQLVAQEHGEILDAISRGEQQTAVSLMRGHLDRARKRVSQRLSETPALPGNRAAAVG